MPAKPSKPSSSKKNTAKKRVGSLTRVVAEMRAVWIFFTRLPWPGDFISDYISGGAKPSSKLPTLKLSEAARAFPFGGVVVGGVGALVLFVAAKSGLHPLASSILAIGATALVSGAIHEDGLADVADSLGAASKTKKLEIMKDSRVGTYGVLALVIVTGLKAGLLAGFPGPGLAAGALFAANVLGRSGLGLMMLSLPPVKKSGLAKAAGTPKQEDAMIALIIGTLIAVLVLGPGTGLAAAAIAGLGLAAVGVLAHRQIGGLTGDVLGAGEQVAEVLVLLALAIILAAAY